jgi:hypothetical protein
MKKRFFWSSLIEIKLLHIHVQQKSLHAEVTQLQD